MTTTVSPVNGSLATTPGNPSRTDGSCFDVAASKIQAKHLERLAVVYIRQSSPHQVLDHRESRELQYKLANRAMAYGWPKDRVWIIDDDQGRSGRTAEGRSGFHQLLAEVSLDHVGLVLGIELGRLARSCKDWYHLLESCALFDVLVADPEGWYDPKEQNDRLLLGLKGMFFEVELHIMQRRLEQGRRHKAERGELFGRLPIGYASGPGGAVTLDPDQQTQSLVRLVFEKFEELGSGRGVLLYLKRHQIKLPFPLHSGPNQGQVEWRYPSGTTLYSMLKNPVYAGAYAFGRRRVDPRRRRSGHPYSGRIGLPREQWHVLIRDHLPAYISWEQYEANQQRLAQNLPRANTLGAPREGSALLAGLVRCGRCGWRLGVDHHAGRPATRYHCASQESEADHTQCQSLPVGLLDDLVGRQVLQVVQPASLELSVQAAQDVERQRQRLHQQRRQQLQRAEYQAQVVKRRYDSVDPENRLVAAQLESDWEQALREQRTLQEEYDRFAAEHPRELSAQELERLKTLSTDLPSLWNDPETSPIDRQEIVRCLVDRVVVNIQGKTEIVEVTIHWKGGYVSHHQVCRPVRSYEMLRDFDRLQQRLAELRADGKTAAEVAECLNGEGFHPPGQRQPFNASMVRMLCSRLKRNGLDASSSCDEQAPGSNEWSVADLSKHLAIPRSVLCKWCSRGWLHARKVKLDRSRWLVWADDEEQDRLRTLHAHQQNNPFQSYPKHLTTPKPIDTT